MRLFVRILQQEKNVAVLTVFMWSSDHNQFFRKISILSVSDCYFSDGIYFFTLPLTNMFDV